MSTQIRAAIYARKSTEQRGDGEDRSVGRQVANARAFVAAKGWQVSEAHVYTDDGISGVKTRKLAAKARMLEVIASGSAPFDAVVMQAGDRLSRRDGDEAVAEMKAIRRAGVRVFFYADGTEFEHGTFQANTLSFLRAEFAAEYRRAVSAKTREAHASRAARGFVCGGRVFGYDNVRTAGHVERVINEAEAKVVRRIYERYAGGAGLPTISHELNERGVPCPRAQQGRINGWCPSSVRAVLKRELYRGVQVWGVKGHRPGADPEDRPVRMPAETWTRTPVPHLRIVSAKLAAAVDARFEAIRARTLRNANGRLIGRPPGEGAKYMLTGLLSCGECGGLMEVLSGANGTGTRRTRVHHYRCSVRRRKGPSLCRNTSPADMAALDAAVLDAVADAVLHPDVVDRALAYAEAAILNTGHTEDRELLARELGKVEKAIARLSRAVGETDGDVSALVDALRSQEERRRELQARLAAAPSVPTVDIEAVRAELRSYLQDWQGLLRGQVAQAQQVLRRLIVGRLKVTPQRGGHYRFEGVGTLRPLLAGTVLGSVQNGASPPGFEPGFQP